MLGEEIHGKTLSEDQKLSLTITKPNLQTPPVLHPTSQPGHLVIPATYLGHLNSELNFLFFAKKGRGTEGKMGTRSGGDGGERETNVK